MLVLTRKQNEEIVIGDNVKVTVLQIKGNSIRLGIEAPKEVRIVRAELPPTPESREVAASSAASSMAEVTVVFSDDRNAAGNQLDIVPFRQASSGLSKSRLGEVGGSAAKPSNRMDKASERTESDATISFQQRLPEALQRNRLQQMVNKVTGRD